MQTMTHLSFFISFDTALAIGTALPSFQILVRCLSTTLASFRVVCFDTRFVNSFAFLSFATLSSKT